jgi:peptidoglycan L-alanyl-D-glutamate endopeptidase CwlK
LDYKTSKLKGVIDMVRDIKELDKMVQVLLELALKDIRAKGVNPLIVETYRPQERQNQLYCQGRTVAECIAKGIPKATAEKYCDPKVGKVTWTLNSIHRLRKAVDIVPQRLVAGKMTAIWNSNDKQTLIIINTMRDYGFEPGADWKKTPDSPHFQINSSFSLTGYFDCVNATKEVTEMIQRALNKKINADLVVDGKWGPWTTAAVNEFRKAQKYSSINGKLGITALKALLS